jgi:hypothetical protein
LLALMAAATFWHKALLRLRTPLQKVDQLLTRLLTEDSFVTSRAKGAVAFTQARHVPQDVAAQVPTCTHVSTPPLHVHTRWPLAMLQRWPVDVSQPLVLKHWPAASVTASLMPGTRGPAARPSMVHMLSWDTSAAGEVPSAFTVQVSPRAAVHSPSVAHMRAGRLAAAPSRLPRISACAALQAAAELPWSLQALTKLAASVVGEVSALLDSAKPRAQDMQVLQRAQGVGMHWPYFWQVSRPLLVLQVQLLVGIAMLHMRSALSQSAFVWQGLASATLALLLDTGCCTALPPVVPWMVHRLRLPAGTTVAPAAVVLDRSQLLVLAAAAHSPSSEHTRPARLPAGGRVCEAGG